MNKKQALEDLFREMSQCQKCPRLVENRTQVIKGRGSSDARILFIGEAPGEDEDKEGFPFVGRYGKKLDKLFAKLVSAGVSIDPANDFYFFFAVNCRPTHLNRSKEKLENATPTPEEINNCKPWLHRLIRILDPYCLVLVGKNACSSFGVTDAMGKIHGKMIDVKVQGVENEIIYAAIPIYPPSFLSSNTDHPQYEENVLRALKGVVDRAWAYVRISQGLPPQPQEE